MLRQPEINWDKTRRKVMIFLWLSLFRWVRSISVASGCNNIVITRISSNFCKRVCDNFSTVMNLIKTRRKWRRAGVLGDCRDRQCT